MSKITKALEKAARERLQRAQEPTAIIVPTAPVVVPVVTTRVSLGDIPVTTDVRVDAHIVSATAAGSPIAEQYRILRANLQSLRLRQGPKAIVVTSSVNGEGKSVTAINLALALARQERCKVALVDADLRKGTVQKWLGLSDRAAGLSSVLRQGGELNGALVHLQSPSLAVLPAGPHPGDPAELLESVAMKRLLALLKTEFDIILIDAPPVLPVADPGILAGQVDGVLFVVRAGKTQRKTVVEAQERLKRTKAALLGCVLTHMEYCLPGSRQYYHYYHHAKQSTGNHREPAAVEPDLGRRT